MIKPVIFVIYEKTLTRQQKVGTDIENKMHPKMNDKKCFPITIFNRDVYLWVGEQLLH